VALTLDHLQQREEHWAIVDLVGKGGHVRTVPVPDWVRSELNDWVAAAAIDRGRLFRPSDAGENPSNREIKSETDCHSASSNV
jgi:site-specific recombinase XerC